jgi:hypothetical protein
VSELADYPVLIVAPRLAKASVEYTVRPDAQQVPPKSGWMPAGQNQVPVPYEADKKPEISAPLPV